MQTHLHQRLPNGNFQVRRLDRELNPW